MPKPLPLLPRRDASKSSCRFVPNEREGDTRPARTPLPHTPCVTLEAVTAQLGVIVPDGRVRGGVVQVSSASMAATIGGMS